MEKIGIKCIFKMEMISYFCKICNKNVGDRRLARKHVKEEHRIFMKIMGKLERIEG